MDALELKDAHLQILRRLSTAPWHTAGQLPDDMVASSEMQELSLHGFVEMSPFGSRIRYILTDLGNNLICQHLTLAERIAHGRATLLDMNDICERLNISRSSFERWRKNSIDNKPNTTHFPKPDIYLVGRARWELATLTQWIIEQTNKEYAAG